ncbi:MAG: hypothetical protein AAF602_24815, partial [Myxococcota bacterium]
LLAGQWLAASLPGLTVAQSVPWVALSVLTLLRSAPGPVHHKVDEAWLAGLGLAVQGVPGLMLGLALMMQRWLAPGRSRGLPLAAVGLLVGAVVVGSYPDALRDGLGGLLGLSRDGQVWTVHLLVSIAEVLGWSALGAHVLGWTKPGPVRARQSSGASAGAWRSRMGSATKPVLGRSGPSAGPTTSGPGS